MAKIGNESKLILKLASERAEKKAQDIYLLKFANAAEPNRNYTDGWRDATNFCVNELYRIVEELENN